MRLTTVSFDYGGPAAASAYSRMDGFTTSPAVDLTAGRTGDAARHTSTGLEPDTAPIAVQWQYTRPDLSTATIARVYVNTDLPNVETCILQLHELWLYVAPDGRLVVQQQALAGYGPTDTGTSVEGGRVTRGTLTASTWHCIELAVVGTFALDSFGDPIPTSIPRKMLAVRLDGVIVARICPPTLTGEHPVEIRLGWARSYGGTLTSGLEALFDDVAVNDDTGSDQNTWPGPGSVYVKLPTGNSTPSYGLARGTGYSFYNGTKLAGNCDGSAFPGQDPGFNYCTDIVPPTDAGGLWAALQTVPPAPVLDPEVDPFVTFDGGTLVSFTQYGDTRMFVRGALQGYCNTFSDDTPPSGFGNKACRLEYASRPDPAGGGATFSYDAFTGGGTIAVTYAWMYHNGDPDFSLNSHVNDDGTLGVSDAAYEADTTAVALAYTDEIEAGSLFDKNEADKVFALPVIVDAGFVPQPPLPSCSRTLLTWT